MRFTQVVVAVSVAALPLLSAACQDSGATTDTSPIIIGADLELSGVDSAIGTTYSRALQLRIDQINAALGDDAVRTELK